MKWFGGWLLFSIILIELYFGLGRWQRTTNPEGKVLSSTSLPAKGLIIPHHLAAEQLIRHGLDVLHQSNPKPKLIFLLVPNHFEAGGAPVITTDQWVGPGQDIGLACLTTTLLPMPFVRLNNDVAENEHAVRDVAPLITEYFPSVPLLPIILSTRLTDEEMTTLVKDMGTCSGSITIAAIDFSHYLPTVEADRHDTETWRLIVERDYARLRHLTNASVDAPTALILFLQLMDKSGPFAIDQLGHDNSGRLNGNLTGATTSYIVALWR